jgi:Zn2+/Cd2+-exporting ATPase
VIFCFVRSGERIAADGFIVDGSAMINESSITGESIPIVKNAGDRVYSSSLIDTGVIILKQITLAKIPLMDESLLWLRKPRIKSKIQRSLETFAQYYTPAIILADHHRVYLD